MPQAVQNNASTIGRLPRKLGPLDVTEIGGNVGGMPVSASIQIRRWM